MPAVTGKKTTEKNSNGKAEKKEATPKKTKKDGQVVEVTVKRKKVPFETPKERKIVHSVVTVCGVEIPLENMKVTVAQAMERLGWTEEKPEEDFGDHYTLIDMQGKKVRCFNNLKNRPFGEGWALTLGQDVLNLHWRLNLETIIIGETDLVISGQHRLIGLVLAWQMWLGWWYNPENKKFEQADHVRDHWREKWAEEPFILSLVACGAKEDDDHTKTIDNVKPRSLSDVLFCSDLFGKYQEADRKVVTRMADAAIRLMWHRTGAGLDAFTPKRTHAESLDFIDRHPKILKAIKHIHEENPMGAIGKYVNPGVAAALLYLMASSKTEHADYDAKRTEKSCDMSMWDKACEFWVLFGSGSPIFKNVKTALGKIYTEDGAGGTLGEKMAIICKAWNEFSTGGSMTEKNLALEYEIDGDGRKHLMECPVVGGIDLGDPDDSENGHGTDDAEEVKERVKAEEKKKDAEGKKEKKDPNAPPLTDAELLEKRKKQIEKLKENRENGKKAKAEDAAPKEKTLADELNAVKDAHKGKIVLFKGLKQYAAWGDDAATVEQVIGKEYVKVKAHEPAGGMKRASFATAQLKQYAGDLIKAGHQVAICEDKDGAPVVTDYSAA